MGTSENDFDDFYHDDPIEETSPTRSRTKFITTSAVILSSIFFFQSTFAGNISLNSSRGIEFGQSVSQAVACSGDTDLTLTPRSSFTNGSPGAHYLKSVTVSDIPESCYGVDFTINAYSDSSGTPLALFNSTSTNAVVYNDNGTFSLDVRITGMTVSSSAGTFTATFNTPVAQSSNVFKITIQSGVHSPLYLVGDRGPGGGTIFYVSTIGFNCGPTFTARCIYLEAAPSGWNVGADPVKYWSLSSNDATDVPGLSSSGVDLTTTEIGLGLKHSIAIVNQGNNNTTAAGAARAYLGGGKADWYVPTLTELNQLCKWARAVAWTSDVTLCSGGTLNLGTGHGLGAAGFSSAEYWSSSAANSRQGLYQSLYNGGRNNFNKYVLFSVRPIRAF